MAKKYRFRVKDKNGSYDTVHLESESDMIVRPNDKTVETSLTEHDNHATNKRNPHGVTKAQIGLGNVDNTADASKSVNYANSAGSANSASNADKVDGFDISLGTSDIGSGASLTTNMIYLVREE